MYNKLQYFSILGALGIIFCESGKGTQVERHKEDIMHGVFQGRAEGPKLNKKHTNVDPLSDFLEDRANAHSINPQLIDQARKDLEALNIYEHSSQIIDKASLQHDPISLGLIGAAYANNFKINQALPWLFASAKGNNPDSLWLLSSLYRRKLIESQNSTIADQLKERAFMLKGSDAKEYFGEK